MKKALAISFVGDISLNGAYDQLLRERGVYYPFERIQEKLASDIVMGNLESPLVPEKVPPAFKMKTPLRADPAYITALKWAGFDVINLSNNHILDYGEMGVASTIGALRAEGISYFGYGQNVAEASRMIVSTVKGTRVGFIGFTDLVIDSPFYANESKRGIAKFELESVCSQLQKDKRLVDILVVSLHWGTEYFHLPTPAQRKYAKQLIDAGADLVIGHHPHTLQGIERYRHGLIAYSLGNFVFSDIKWNWENEKGEKRTTYYKFSGRLREGLILSVNFTEQGLDEYQVYPTCISSSGQVLTGSNNILRRLEDLTEELNHSDYENRFRRELERFERNKLIRRMIGRGKRFYKLRPKHFLELREIISNILGSFE